MLEGSQVWDLGRVCMCVWGSRGGERGVFSSKAFSVLVVRFSFLNVFFVPFHITFSSLTVLSLLHNKALFLI